MKEQITTNQFYDLAVDVTKNRLYITSKGFWNKGEIIEAFRKCQAEALKHVKANFTVVADMREFKILPQDLVSMQEETQKDLAKAGMYRVACIVPASAVANFQLRDVAKGTEMPEQRFAVMSEGEDWLDTELSKL
ncbi:MAG: hypothetical protein JEZ14_03325 [Marinilabiliaceae bacterium]|nr:hypothetical protein [Marinilabiliaceae bacterium]